MATHALLARVLRERALGWSAGLAVALLCASCGRPDVTADLESGDFGAQLRALRIVYDSEDPSDAELAATLMLAESEATNVHVRMAACAVAGLRAPPDQPVENVLGPLAMSESGRIALCAELALAQRDDPIRSGRPRVEFSTSVHGKLTRETLVDLGWTADAAEEVVDYNIATDLSQLSTDPWLSWLPLFFWSANSRTDDVQRLASSATFNTDWSSYPPDLRDDDFSDRTTGFHFDDLFQYDDFVQRWSDLAEWAQTKAPAAGSSWSTTEMNDWLCVHGMVLHAVQDFYAHADWPQLFRPVVGDVEAAEYPTWDDFHDPRTPWRDGTQDRAELVSLLAGTEGRITAKKGEPGLQSGWYFVPDPASMRPGLVGKPWRHDHPSGEFDDIARSLARRASREWVERLDGMLPPEHRATFRRSVRDHD